MPARWDIAVRGSNATANTASPTPISHNLHPAGIHNAGKIVSNLIRDRLVEDALAAKGLQIQLETLEFHALRHRFKPNGDRSKIGVPSHWADRGEFLSDVFDEEGCLGWGGEYFKECGVWHRGKIAHVAGR